MTGSRISWIIQQVAAVFPTLGGSNPPPKGNLIAATQQNPPLQFAAGTDVEQVVRFVLDRATMNRPMRKQKG